MMTTSQLNHQIIKGESTLVDRMLDSLSSSSTFSLEYSLLSSASSMSSSSSSSSSSSLSFSLSSSHEDMSTENDSIKDQEQSFLQLTIEVQQQDSIVIAPFQDHLVNLGRGPVVSDPFQSDCVENCNMQEEHLTTICQKLWL